MSSSGGKHPAACLAQGLGLGQHLGALSAAACVPLPPLLCPGPGYHVRGVFYGWNPTHSHLLPGPPSHLPVEDVNHSGRSRTGRAVPWVALPDQAAHKLTLPSPQTAGSTSDSTTAMCW